MKYNTVKVRHKKQHLRLEVASADLASCCKTQQRFQYLFSSHMTTTAQQRRGWPTVT